jgi:hypothetical protein
MGWEAATGRIQAALPLGAPPWLAASAAPFGSLGTVHVSPRPGAPWVIHIQDVHGHLGAQKNMAGFLAGLGRDKRLSWVGVEGAAGGFRLEALQKFPYPDIVGDVGDYFLKENYIGGAERAVWTTPGLNLWGVEDPRDYLANIEAFKSGRARSPDLKARLALWSRGVAELKARFYTPALRRLDARVAAFHHKGGLADYVKALAEIKPAGDTLPNARRLYRVMEMEKALDFARVEADRRRLAVELSRSLARADLEDLAQKSLAHKTGHLTLAVYHRALTAQARRAGLSPGRSLAAYFEYAQLAEQISLSHLPDELARWESGVFDSLCATPPQRELAALTEDLRLVDTLTRFAMTPSDWARYQARRMRVGAIPSRLEDLGSPSPLQGEGGRRPREGISLSPFEDFCRLALDRNGIFVQNLAAKMTREKAPVAALVAGGFHTEGMEPLLSRQGFSYAIFTPRVEGLLPTEDSLDLLTRPPTPLEKLFAPEKITLKAPLSIGVVKPTPGYLKPALVLFLVATLVGAGKYFDPDLGHAFQTMFPGVSVVIGPRGVVTVNVGDRSYVVYESDGVVSIPIRGKIIVTQPKNASHGDNATKPKIPTRIIHGQPSDLRHARGAAWGALLVGGVAVLAAFLSSDSAGWLWVFGGGGLWAAGVWWVLAGAGKIILSRVQSPPRDANDTRRVLLPAPFGNTEIRFVSGEKLQKVSGDRHGTVFAWTVPTEGENPTVIYLPAVLGESWGGFFQEWLRKILLVIVLAAEYPHTTPLQFRPVSHSAHFAVFFSRASFFLNEVITYVGLLLGYPFFQMATVVRGITSPDPWTTQIEGRREVVRSLVGMTRRELASRHIAVGDGDNFGDLNILLHKLIMGVLGEAKSPDMLFSHHSLYREMRETLKSIVEAHGGRIHRGEGGDEFEILFDGIPKGRMESVLAGIVVGFNKAFRGKYAFYRLDLENEPDEEMVRDLEKFPGALAAVRHGNGVNLLVERKILGEGACRDLTQITRALKGDFPATTVLLRDIESPEVGPFTISIGAVSVLEALEVWEALNDVFKGDRPLTREEALEVALLGTWMAGEVLKEAKAGGRNRGLILSGSKHWRLGILRKVTGEKLIDKAEKDYSQIFPGIFSRAGGGSRDTLTGALSHGEFRRLLAGVKNGIYRRVDVPRYVAGDGDQLLPSRAFHGAQDGDYERGNRLIQAVGGFVHALFPPEYVHPRSLPKWVQAVAMALGLPLMVPLLPTNATIMTRFVDRFDVFRFDPTSSRPGSEKTEQLFTSLTKEVEFVLGKTADPAVIVYEVRHGDASPPLAGKYQDMYLLWVLEMTAEALMAEANQGSRHGNIEALSERLDPYMGVDVEGGVLYVSYDPSKAMALGKRWRQAQEDAALKALLNLQATLPIKARSVKPVSPSREPLRVLEEWIIPPPQRQTEVVEDAVIFSCWDLGFSSRQNTSAAHLLMTPAEELWPLLTVDFMSNFRMLAEAMGARHGALDWSGLTDAERERIHSEEFALARTPWDLGLIVGDFAPEDLQEDMDPYNRSRATARRKRSLRGRFQIAKGNVAMVLRSLWSRLRNNRVDVYHFPLQKVGGEDGRLDLTLQNQALLKQLAVRLAGSPRRSIGFVFDGAEGQDVNHIVAMMVESLELVGLKDARNLLEKAMFKKENSTDPAILLAPTRKKIGETMMGEYYKGRFLDIHTYNWSRWDLRGLAARLFEMVPGVGEVNATFQASLDPEKHRYIAIQA